MAGDRLRQVLQGRRAVGLGVRRKRPAAECRFNFRTRLPRCSPSSSETTTVRLTALPPNSFASVSADTSLTASSGAEKWMLLPDGQHVIGVAPMLPWEKPRSRRSVTSSVPFPPPIPM